MVFLICSAIHFEPPSSLRHSLRSMRSARNTSPTRPTGRSEVRGERLKPGSTSARLKARKKPRGDDPRGFLVDKIGAKIGAKPKLPSGSLLPQRILAEKGGILEPLWGKCLRWCLFKRTTKRTTGEKKCFYRVFLLVAFRESLATRLRNSRSAAIG